MFLGFIDRHICTQSLYLVFDWKISGYSFTIKKTLSKGMLNTCTRKVKCRKCFVIIFCSFHGVTELQHLNWGMKAD